MCFQEKLFSDSESIQTRAEAAVLLKQLDFPVCTSLNCKIVTLIIEQNSTQHTTISEWKFLQGCMLKYQNLISWSLTPILGNGHSVALLASEACIRCRKIITSDSSSAINIFLNMQQDESLPIY